MTVTLNPSPATFPMTEMIDCGLWADLKPSARAVLAVIWDFHRRFPDACHPNRTTLSDLSGVSEPTVTRAITELSECGLVERISRPPSCNTYRLNWADISVTKKTTSRRKSPYQPPDPDSSTTLYVDRHGREKASVEKHNYGWNMPDGCYLRSAAETAIHAFLVDWKVPHWSNVPYRKLGISGLHEEATVDFVVGPRLLIEVFGLPRIQTQAIKYNANRRKKEAAIAAAGWKLMALESNVRELTEKHCNTIITRWADSIIEDAQALYHEIRDAGQWRDGEPSTLLLLDLVKDARQRRDVKKEPASPRGLYERDYDSQCVIGSVETIRQYEPRIVLGEHYGRDKEVQGENSPTPTTSASMVNASLANEQEEGSKTCCHDLYIARLKESAGQTPAQASASPLPNGANAVDGTQSGKAAASPQEPKTSKTDREEMSFKDDMRRPDNLWVEDWMDPIDAAEAAEAAGYDED